MALSVGSTPAQLFRKLAAAPFRDNISWQNVHFFWGDERCVPPDHPESNYGMTRNNLLNHISIPDENIHRIVGENDPEYETKRYTSEICQLTPAKHRGLPQFDWILLGIGTDGHTASIFPGSDVLDDRNKICAVATHPEIGQKRITLTLPVINHAKLVSFLVAGENKTSVVAKILARAEKSKSLPASLVRPVNGILEWYLDQANLNVIPQTWFRNSWAWKSRSNKPQLRSSDNNSIQFDHKRFSRFNLNIQNEPELLFCDNETNMQRLNGLNDVSGYFKDGINNYIVQATKDAINSEKIGTKAGLNYKLTIPANGSATVKLRLCNRTPKNQFQGFDQVFEKRIHQADEFYNKIQSEIKDNDARNVQRQAFAGMLWTKQFYYYDVEQWLKGDLGQPEPPRERLNGRNHEWEHLNNADIISMPDKWEYPWYAAWDLAFHCIPLAMIDPEFAKQQLVLLTREWYMHPNGQLPAYEWAFGDVNPPVHAWATWRVFQIDRKMNGDIAFLERVFHKMLLNFTWWVNRKNEHGHNIFQGGFLGLDNIGVFDRSSELPTGEHLEQADGTSWMTMYSLNMMRIALELALTNPVYQDLATKFFEHFLYIAGAMRNIGGKDIDSWDEEDEFYYDVLRCSHSNHTQCEIVSLKVRSMVGLIPLFAVETLEPDLLDRTPEFKQRLEWFLNNRPDLANLISRW